MSFRRIKDKNYNIPLSHGIMKYRCEKCGKEWFMHLEVGVEDWGKNGRPHQPCPFIIGCDCGGMAQDVSGLIPFGSIAPIDIGDRYFKYDNSGRKDAHGIPATYAQKR
ncbi:MAG: hypothetical protein PHY71_02260 [Bacteroidaceae bacterium]|nr:hypothetical protein [Bacteroidaceae bacterium]